MPGTDMNIEECRKYRGSGIKPDDFDEFWRITFLDIEKSKPHITLEPAGISVPGACCYWAKLHTEGLENVELYAKVLIPCVQQDPILPVCIVFHDYPEASRSWFHLTRYLSLGMIVIAPDCRNQAGRSHGGSIGKGTGSYGPMFHGLEEPVENMYLYRIFYDAVCWLKAVSCFPKADSNQIHVYGAGQGAALALACAYSDTKVRTCGLHYPMLCDYRRVWDKDFVQSGYMGLHYFFRWHDPLHEHADDIFHKLDYVDICHMASGISCDCLVSTGLADMVSPPSCQFAVVNQMTCNVRHLVYPKHGHELNNFFENEYLKFLIAHLELQG